MGYKFESLQDAQRIDRAVNQVESFRHLPRRRNPRPYHQHPAYVAICGSEIDAMAFAGGKWTPGTGTATIYEVDSNGDLADAGIDTETVYNCSESAIPASTPFLCWREFVSGKLVAAAGSGTGDEQPAPVIRGYLTSDLARNGSATLDIWAGAPGSLATTGTTKTVYGDYLISAGYKLASGTWVNAFYSHTEDEGGESEETIYYVSAANPCEVQA